MAPVTLADAGKAITRERATVEGRDTLALQGRVALARGAAGEEAHAPAVAAVAFGAAEHTHAAQPSVWTAEEAQQQPERQRLVPQSALEPHASPGELSRQEPKGGAQVAQPSSAAEALQQ